MYTFVLCFFIGSCSKDSSLSLYVVKKFNEIFIAVSNEALSLAAILQYKRAQD